MSQSPRCDPGAPPHGALPATPPATPVRVLFLGTWRGLERALASSQVPGPGDAAAETVMGAGKSAVAAVPSLAVPSLAVPSLADLERHLARGAHPAVVLSRLFWPGGDALEAARLLGRLGFAGAYRAVAPPLPRPDIVRREVTRVAPGLDFELVLPEPVPAPPPPPPPVGARPAPAPGRTPRR